MSNTTPSNLNEPAEITELDMLKQKMVMVAHLSKTILDQYDLDDDPEMNNILVAIVTLSSNSADHFCENCEANVDAGWQAAIDLNGGNLPAEAVKGVLH